MSIKVEHHDYDEITGLYTETSKDEHGQYVGGRWEMDYWGKAAQQELMLRCRLAHKGFEFVHYRGMETSYVNRVIFHEGAMA